MDINNSSIAQWSERTAYIREVGGSSPSTTTNGT